MTSTGRISWVVYRLGISPGDDRISEITLVPFRRRRFRLERASSDDVAWLASTLDRECDPLGSGIQLDAAGELRLRW